MAGPFRPAGGPNSASVVLAELARLWDQAEHRAVGRGERLTQKRLAGVSRVPLTTVNSWATGRSLPRDLDQLTAVGAVLARWAGEDPPGEREWDRLLRIDQTARGVLGEGGGKGASVGWPVAELTDPFALEVHRPVQPEDAPPGLPVLPPYVPREHDQVLGQVVRAAADGRSGIAVLVGGSSTGKTRACWEALDLLRDQDPPWRLWHPIDPSRPDAALRELPGIGPRTVVWLNEAQFYLDPAEAGLGERVAAGLRELLRDPGRAPVLVLATAVARVLGHPDRPAAGGCADPHAQARELLAGHDITVPAAFTSAQMSQLARAADARMALAARSAPDGEVIQFLAGAPELLARYRHAPPAAAALIDAAMDARRLGMGAGLPQAFLEAAAPGYLTDAEWDALGEDWLEQALAYTAVPRKGARGPLTRIRPRPARPAARTRRDQPASMAAAAGPLYRLADYLDQHGRAHRASQIPPAEFWSAAAAHAAPGDQAALGDAADARGLYRDAAQLHKNAAASGNLRAAFYLSRGPPDCLSADPRPAHWAAAHVALDDPDDVADLLDSLREAGAHEQAAALLARDPAAHVPLDNPDAVAGCWAACGWRAQPARAAHAPLDDPARGLLRSCRAHGQQPRCWPATPPPTSPSTTRSAWPAAGQPAGAGADEQAAALAGPGRRPRPPRQPGRRGQPAGQPAGGGRGRAGRRAAPGPAAHAPLDDPAWSWPTCWTACCRRPREQAGAARAGRRAGRAPPPTPPSTTRGRGPPAGPPAGGGRGRAGRRAGCPGRRPRPPRRPVRVASLLDSLREAGADEQAAALLARDPAAHVFLDEPGRRGPPAGRPAGERARTSRPPRWPSRAAAHAPLDDDPADVARLLDSLREAGAHEQAAALADSAAGGRTCSGSFRRAAEAPRISSVSDGRPTAPRPRHGAGKTWTYGLFPTAGTVRRPCPSAYRRPAEFAR